MIEKKELILYNSVGEKETMVQSFVSLSSFDVHEKGTIIAFAK